MAVSILLCRFNESTAAGLLRYCVGAQRKRGTPTGPTLLLKTVLERGTVFMFVSPRANSIFLQNYTGQQGLKPALHWEKRLREDGKRGYVDTQFSSQMEVFHVVNTEMPTRQTIGAAPLLLFMHIAHVIIHKDAWGGIHRDRCLSRKPVRDILYLIDLQAQRGTVSSERRVWIRLWISHHTCCPVSAGKWLICIWRVLSVE